jgi:hypothetical protein
VCFPPIRTAARNSRGVRHEETRAHVARLDVRGSDCLDAAYYSAKDKTLTIEFAKGGTYQFDGIPRSIAKAIENDDPGEVVNSDVL